jgi:hypothetical protein
MTKREAKKAACWHAATVLMTALSWWEIDSLYPDSDDCKKIEAALQEVVEELERRGRLGHAEPKARGKR